MAVKTFTDNTALPASDINTFLANSGLVYVTGGALATATTLFQNCFTATFRNYRIVIDNIGCSALSDVYLRLLQGSSETTGALGNNYWALYGITSGGALGNSAAAANVAFYTGVTFSGATTGSGNAIIDLCSPQIPNVTTANINSFNIVASLGAYRSRIGGAAYDGAAVFDGFAVKSLSAATLTGNVTVYGYRQV
jgi:hypothetical protein